MTQALVFPQAMSITFVPPTGPGAEAPSVQTIAATLGSHGPMTSAELRGITGLPRRTIYAALRSLRQGGLLRERPSLRDTRQTYFWLAKSSA